MKNAKTVYSLSLVVSEGDSLRRNFEVDHSGGWCSVRVQDHSGGLLHCLDTR